MKLIIRDDDISYYTNVNHLHTLYNEAINEGLKVNFAVIPSMIKTYHRGVSGGMYFGPEQESIDKNIELVTWLSDHVKNKRIEIMLHGYDHAYAIRRQKQYDVVTKVIRDDNMQNEHLYPECFYKEKNVLKKELKEGKELLEDTFHIKVTTFVAPHNLMSRDAAAIVAELGMNVSGTMNRHFNRPVDYYSIKNYMIKTKWKNKNKNPYHDPLLYKKNIELDAHYFDPSINLHEFDLLLKQFVDDKNVFAFFTHHWKVTKDQEFLAYYQQLMKTYASRSILINDYLQSI